MRHKARPKLYRMFRQLDGKQSPYCPAVFDTKSRIRNFWCLVKGTPEFHPDGYYYQPVKRDGKWAWVALGRDPSTAWNKSLAQAKVREPEFVHGIPGVPEPKPEPTPAPKDRGLRMDDEVKAYLSNVAKLAPKTFKAYNCSRSRVRKSTSTRSVSKTSNPSTRSSSNRVTRTALGTTAFSMWSRS
jgi:hypothetical protein